MSKYVPLLEPFPHAPGIPILCQWATNKLEQREAFSLHHTWVGAWLMTKRMKDYDLFIFGPYWPSWVLGLMCFLFGHWQYHSTAVWVRDRDMPPTNFSCARCSFQMSTSWNTFGKTVKYGDGSTYDGEWHDAL